MHRIRLVGSPASETMDTKQILTQLHAERNRIDRAIAAIEGIHSEGGSRSGSAAPRKRPAADMRLRRRLRGAADLDRETPSE